MADLLTFNLQNVKKDKPFTTSAYCKPAFSIVYTHFGSFLPPTYKFGTVYILAYRCLGINLD